MFLNFPIVFYDSSCSILKKIYVKEKHIKSQYCKMYLDSYKQENVILNSVGKIRVRVCRSSSKNKRV
jgi:hypothetical protein